MATGAGRMGKTVQWLIGMEVSSDLSVKFLEDHPIEKPGSGSDFCKNICLFLYIFSGEIRHIFYTEFRKIHVTSQ